MNGLDVVNAIESRLDDIATGAGYNTSAGSRVYLGRTRFDEGDTYPLITLVVPDTDIRQTACAVHSHAMTLIVEGHFAAATGGDVLTPGYALLDDIKKALSGVSSDYSIGTGKFAPNGERVFPREDSADIGVCQLRIQATFSENHAA